MKAMIFSNKLIKNLFSFVFLILLVVSLMSFKKIEQVRADTSVSIPYISITSTGSFNIPSEGGEIMVSASVHSSQINNILYNPSLFIENINSHLQSKGDADMCVTSLSYVDSGTVYFTLLFGPNTFDSEQVIGVMGAYGGYISVMQDAD